MRGFEQRLKILESRRLLGRNCAALCDRRHNCSGLPKVCDGFCQSGAVLKSDLFLKDCPLEGNEAKCKRCG